jgi:hypothetical protein
MDTASSDLVLRMRDRVRRHLLTSIGGIGVSVLVAGAMGLFTHLAFGDAPGLLRAAPVLAVFVIPAIGLWSTYRNLRCPSCERNVAFQVAFNYSLFAGIVGRRTCDGCGAKIFPDDLPRRYRRMFAILFALGLGLGVVSAIVSSLSRH